jgi:GDP-D-mannose dehydratase
MGSYDKIKQAVGWEPKTSLEELVTLMCNEEIHLNNFFNKN